MNTKKYMTTSHTMNRRQQVSTGVKFNCMVVMRGAHLSYCQFYQRHLASGKAESTFGKIAREWISFSCWSFLFFVPESRPNDSTKSQLYLIVQEKFSNPEMYVNTRIKRV